MTLSSKLFNDPQRIELIQFAQSNIDSLVDSMAVIPNGSDTSYRTAVTAANLVWFKSLLHIADPKKYKATAFAKFNKPLSYEEFIEWIDTSIMKFGAKPPSQEYTVLVFTQQLIYNGKHYVG